MLLILYFAEEVGGGRRIKTLEIIKLRKNILGSCAESKNIIYINKLRDDESSLINFLA